MHQASISDKSVKDVERTDGPRRAKIKGLDLAPEVSVPIQSLKQCYFPEGPDPPPTRS